MQQVIRLLQKRSNSTKLWSRARAGVITSLCVLVMIAETASWALSRDTKDEDSSSTELVILCPDSQRQGIKLECDGNSMPVPGTGPWRIASQPGSHRISAKRDGYFPIDVTVEVQEGQSATVALVWQPLSGNPPSAEPAVIETTAPPKTAAKPKRLPIPSATVQRDIIRLVNEAYRLDDTKTPAENVALSKQLASMAVASKAPEERFVLYRRAAELANDAGHLPLMCQMIEVIGAEFDIDTLVVQAKMFAKYANVATSSAAVTVGLDGAKELINRALFEDRYDVALTMIESAKRLCEESAETQDYQQWEQKRAEVERLEGQWRKVCAAAEMLKTAPENPVANLTLGRWVWFQKGDAKQGLSYLAKGNDTSLKALARQDLTFQATDVESVLSLANAWWDLSQKHTGVEQEQLARHAGQWYKIALPELPDGLTKAVVQRRLEEIASPKSPVAEATPPEPGNTSGGALPPGEALPCGRWSDLMPLIDVKRDAVSGFWERKEDSLIIKRPKANSTILLPVTAEGDYRLEAQFTRTDGQDAVAMVILVGGRPCLLAFSESSGKVSRMAIADASSQVQRTNQIRVEPGSLANNQRHAVSILVRLNGDMASVRVLLNGESYFYWSGYQKAVTAEGWPALPAQQFALGADGAIVFHSVRLRPISGKATLTIPPSREGAQARTARRSLPCSM